MISSTVGTLDPVTPYFTFNKVRVATEYSELRQIMVLRYEVYCLECGFLPAEQFQNGLETDDYDLCSTHFTAHNLNNEVVGSLRIVQPAASQCFPFEEHCKALHKDAVLPPRQECGEISRLVVRKSYRRRTGDSLAGVSESFLADPAPNVIQSDPGSERRSNSPQILLGLYREAYRYSLQAGIRYWYAAMEKPLARTLTRFDFVFTPIGMETDYYGPVTPYIADLRELEARLGESNPELLEWMRGTILMPQADH
ncbi:MAG TPA: PEP-CTERM/exosortase system-associated acyltransferase [Patescibacteria group bacterium]|nr:PEP-CTERM/exosortase system-associated acyltransferase [Patescibacteria group bacterium]